jgi:crossover junction endodeoxyribonuclease RuvC
MLDRNGALVSDEAILDMPIVRDGKLKWVDANIIAGWIRTMRHLSDDMEIYSTCERITPLPQNGRMGAFSQGCNFGSLLACLVVSRARVELVTPGRWKEHFNLDSDKQASVDKANLLFPTASLARKKDHGRAEALLIAHYAFLNRPR